jgi:hypothetical protein
MKKISRINYKIFLYLVIIGNMAYILFLLYNGIDEGFRDIGSIQSIAPIGMIFLLILNIFLLYHQRNNNIQSSSHSSNFTE